MAEQVALTEMKMNEWIQDFCGKVRRKETTRKTMWVDNIKVELREIGSGGMDWIRLARIGTSGCLHKILGNY
jgi:hypothetical protein